LKQKKKKTIKGLKKKKKKSCFKGASSKKRGRLGEEEKPTFRLDTNIVKNEIEKSKELVLVS
jgi:hypothetical protein